jgi:hypothetical protein
MSTRLDEIVHVGSTVFKSGKSLSEIFSHEIKNDKMAWYIDYYTQNAEHYRVRYLATEAVNGHAIMMTNENKEARDPSDPEGGQWLGSDVAPWFKKDGSDSQHRWVFLFEHVSGETYGVHCEANRVFLFGPASLSLPTSNLWDEYVEHGIYGPIRSAAEFDQSQLESIIIDPDVHGSLEKKGLLIEYTNALASLLD